MIKKRIFPFVQMYDDDDVLRVLWFVPTISFLIYLKLMLKNFYYLQINK